MEEQKRERREQIQNFLLLWSQELDKDRAGGEKSVSTDRTVPPPGISHGSAEVWVEVTGAGPKMSASSNTEDLKDTKEYHVLELVVL